jgi:rhomboid protease GluP
MLTTLDASDPSTRAATAGFAEYAAKCLIAEHGHQAGIPEEARALAAAADYALVQAAQSLIITLIVDREKQPDRTFALAPADVVAAASACRGYSGSVNGFKMPVNVNIYEIGREAPSAADKARLSALARRLPGLAGVVVTAVHVDVVRQGVWTTAPLGGLLYKRWIKRLLNAPRRSDAALAEAQGAMPDMSGKPVVTCLLLLAMAAVFALEQLSAVAPPSGFLAPDVKTLLAMGGMHGELVRTGEWSRLLSAAFLHADPVHLLLNGVALAMAGFLLEALLGSARLLAFFVLSAVGGSLAGLWLNDPNVVSVGASGAVMGLLAGLFVLAHRLPSGPDRTLIQTRAAQFLVPSLLPVFARASDGPIDLAAHCGGAVVGGLLGYGILKAWRRDVSEPPLRRLFLGAATLGAVVVAVSGVAAAGRYVEVERGLATSQLLAPTEAIPEDLQAAIDTVDQWGAGFERDPRVRFFRMHKRHDAGALAQAIAEGEAAIAERELLDEYFPDGSLAAAVREDLAGFMAEAGRVDEARSVAAELCRSGDDRAKAALAEKGLCR